MKAIVTGSAGFIGSHLCEQLLKAGHEVCGIDNLASGQMSNMAGFQNQPNFRFEVLDINDKEHLARVFRDVDWVFHLAGLADIVPSIEHPDRYYHANVAGTFNVLECARNAGVKRLIYAASSSCYGIPDQYPTPETAPIQPQYPYALTKYLGEQMVLHWGKVYGLPVVSLRLFNVYGPRSRTSGTYGAVFGVFLAQKRAGKPFTVVGDGNQTRDFTYVTDVVDAFLQAAQSTLCDEVFNIGSGGHYSINQLVGLLGGEKVHIPKRPGEPDCTFADTSKIRAQLGWKPKVDFELGVRHMLSHIDDWEQAPVWDRESIAEATSSWFRFLGERP